MRARRKTTRRVGEYLIKNVAVAAVLSGSVVNGAELSPSQVRVSLAGDKFDGVVQYAVSAESSAPSILRAHHADLAVGAISSSSDSEVFLSYGPVWRLQSPESAFFVDFGIAPTLISDSKFGGRDLGGRFHFTSSVSFGASFGRSNIIALRIQHLSNGGLNATNPGMDMIGLEFSIRFSD